jgi:fused signal recognition particle receptor
LGLFDVFKRKPATTHPASAAAGEPQEAADATLAKGLSKTRTSLVERITRAVAGKSTVDDDVLDELEAALLQADVGVETTVRIIKGLKARVARERLLHAGDLDRLLREEITSILMPNRQAASEDTIASGPKPYVLLVVGVNGVGKTTTIGKLAHQFTQQGLRVLLGAGDTFRAAAVEQLRIWSQRTGADFVDKGMGADPAAVAYAALDEGIKRGADLVIIDTAGRLHNKVHLMNELSKVRRSLSKLIPDAPHEVLLVLDGSTGQNAIQQAIEFSKATQVTALALTKLDGTAKGGVVIGISDRLQIPVRYIGVGEGIDDLQAFDPEAYITHLLGK